MSDEHEVELRFRFEGEAVAGRLAADDGPEQTFTGWLGLLSALEAVRDGEWKHPPPVV
jgi:hypothetical protein